MAIKTNTVRENTKKREKGTHSQEIELALAQLQETTLKVSRNFNVMISDITGDPPEQYLEDEKTDEDRGIRDSDQVPLLIVLQELPNQLRSTSQRLVEMDKRIEYLRGLLTGSLS